MSDLEAPTLTSDALSGSSVDDLKKRKRDHEEVLGHQLRSTVAKALANTAPEPNTHDIDHDAKKRKVHSEPRPRTRRSSAFGLPTIPEVPSPPPAMARPKTGQEPSIAREFTSKLLAQKVETMYKKSTAAAMSIPPPPPPRTNHGAAAAASSSALHMAPPSPAITTAAASKPRAVPCSSKQVPPPPPPPLPIQRGQAVAGQPPPLMFRPHETTTAAKNYDNNTLHHPYKQQQEGDTQPSLAHVESSSFDSPIQPEAQEPLKDEQKLLTTTTRTTGISFRSILRKLAILLGASMAAFCFLLIAVSLVSSIDDNGLQDDDPGLHLHLMLPPNHMEQINATLDENSLRQYWKDHAPPQAVELLEHVERTSNNHVESIDSDQQLNNELSTSTSTPATGMAPMCVSFFVQSVSDLLAATKIQVSFPEILVREGASSGALLGSSSPETAMDAVAATALVPVNNTKLEKSLLSRMTAFRFPLLSWMHAADQHVIVMKEQQQALPEDGKLLSMEIRACDDDDDDDSDGDTSMPGTKRKRRRRKVLKGAARLVEGTTKKIQKEADKLRHGVQDAGNKLRQGLGGIKDKTGGLLMNVASWHKNKKWL